MMKRTVYLIVVFFLFSFKIEELPDVLIIGDSISIGYTPFVREALKGKARVVHNKGNAQHTGNGLEKLDEWLGDTKWEVIHFNWGLWDLCYRMPDGNGPGKRDKVNGKLTFTPEEYRNNLEALVSRLETTGAKLIFAETTCVPRGEEGRFANDDRRYNKAAMKVIRAHHITVNRLNRLSRKVHKRHALGENDVHYTPEGYKELARPVIELITENL